MAGELILVVDDEANVAMLADRGAQVLLKARAQGCTATSWRNEGPWPEN